MTRQIDELDRHIDALNAGDAPAVDAEIDPELAGLLNAVTRIRRLREVESSDDSWPEQAVRDIARELKQSAASVRGRAPVARVDEGAARTAERLDPTLLSTDQVRDHATHRRRIPRELTQMAAAILVLVLVGGVLTVLFRGQSVSNQGGVGAGVTPTAAMGSQLPMTVTVNGVSVTLQLVDSTSTATRFTFAFRMSPDQVSHDQPFPSMLGPKPAEDVTIDGITPAPNDPYVSELAGIASNPNIGFTLDYQSPFPPNKTVTITIQHLTLPTTKETPEPNQPASSQSIEGPWTFTITPDAVANQPMPNPPSGVARFAGVSAAQAQQWSSFPITAPNPLPAVLSNAQVLKRNEFNVNGYGLGVPETAAANYVLFTYDQPLGQVVFLAETTNAAAAPNISGDSAILLMPGEPSGKTGTWAISPGTLSHPKIVGVIITRFEVSTSAGNGPMVVYVWKIGEVDYLIWHVLDSSRPGITTVTDADLQEMVASIIEQRGGDTSPATVPSGQPTPGPLPTSTSFSAP